MIILLLAGFVACELQSFFAGKFCDLKCEKISLWWYFGHVIIIVISLNQETKLLLFKSHSFDQEKGHFRQKSFL